MKPYKVTLPEPETRKPRLTAEERAFARYLDKGLTVEAAAARIGRSKRHGFRLMARLRDVHSALSG